MAAGMAAAMAWRGKLMAARKKPKPPIKFSSKVADEICGRRVDVYVLRCPDSNDVRYVGVTREGIKRLNRHIREARARRSHRHCWINKLEREGKRPVFEVVEGDVADWSEAERRWIAHYRALGARLVNGNDGGDCMYQVREKEGLWPNYKASMRQIGQHIFWLRRHKPSSPAIAKGVEAQARLKAAARRAKAEGWMDALDARLSHVVS